MKTLLILFFGISFFNPSLVTVNDISMQESNLLNSEIELKNQDLRRDVDLVVASIQIHLGTCEEGTPFSWTVVVCNNGVSSSPSSTTGMYLFKSPSDIEYLEFSVPALSGQSCFAFSGSGTHTIGNAISIQAEADYYDDVKETNESNNNSSQHEEC